MSNLTRLDLSAADLNNESATTIANSPIFAQSLKNLILYDVYGLDYEGWEVLEGITWSGFEVEGAEY